MFQVTGRLVNRIIRVEPRGVEKLTVVCLMTKNVQMSTDTYVLEIGVSMVFENIGAFVLSVLIFRVISIIRTVVLTLIIMIIIIMNGFIKWTPSSKFVSSSIPSWQILTAHAQPFRGARDLAFCLKVPFDSLLVWASSGGSGETARMRRLAWTFAARIGDKYQIRLTRSK